MTIDELSSRLTSDFKKIKESFLRASSSQDLYLLKSRHLGTKSVFQNMIKNLHSLPPDQKPRFGKLWNQKKIQLEKIYKKQYLALTRQEQKNKIESERIDLSLPGPEDQPAPVHPIRLVTNKIVDIFTPLGFSVHLGPMIETDWNNFQALNMPKNHPARDLQDSFYIDETHVLRTHTSPVQIHALKENKFPLAMLAPGTVFRKDSDSSHAPSFHQVEGMYIDHHVSMAHLKGCLAYFFKQLFGKKTKTRFRPSYFPFTEPSAEYDCSCPMCFKQKGCPLCGHTGWIEIGGCGLVHPRVFSLSHVDPTDWQGFAFGLGIERLAMVCYGVPNIKLFMENDLRFLKQFSFFA